MLELDRVSCEKTDTPSPPSDVVLLAGDSGSKQPSPSFNGGAGGGNRHSGGKHTTGYGKAKGKTKREK